MSVAAAQSVAVYKGLMLAEIVAHTDGQTLRILKYRRLGQLSPPYSAPIVLTAIQVYIILSSADGGQ